MAAVRSKAQLPVGSAQWITDENQQVSLFGVQEAEDFAFSARNEVEWLNEHMAEIFSKNQVDVTEIFKTPGKLRGKTPRTARKRNPLEVREPLTDIFSTKSKPYKIPSKDTDCNKEIIGFQVADDSKAAVPVQHSKANTDSGYHGMSEDEMDVDGPTGATQPLTNLRTFEKDPTPPKPPTHAQPFPSTDSEERSPADGSFETAKEDITSQEIRKADPQPDADHDAVMELGVIDPQKFGPALPNGPLGGPRVPEEVMDLDEMDHDSILGDAPIDDSRSPSEGSSPAKPLVRKSSLTFAALPAREPLTTKKSIGSRVSRTSHLDQSKTAINRGSFLGRLTVGKTLGGVRQPEPAPEVGSNEDVDKDEVDRPELPREESDGDMKMAKLHSKSSTQQLHDKINMLGKSQPARPTKSIPAAAALPNATYPELPTADTQVQAPAEASGAGTTAPAVHVPEDDDDDWIKPPQTQPNDSSRPKLSKSTSVDVMEDIRGKHNISDQDFGFDRHNKEQNREPSPLRQSVMADSPQRIRQSRSASSSTFASPARAALRSETKYIQAHESDLERKRSPDQSTTPIGTPTKRQIDGPLSASKSKLQSIMKTARGLFTSSAGVSAQAKMETLSTHTKRTEGQMHGSPGGSNTGSKLKSSGLNGELYPNLRPAGQIQSLVDQQPPKQVNIAEPRKTRSSTEKEEKKRERETREQHSAEVELGSVREAQNQDAVAHKQAKTYDAPGDIQVVEPETTIHLNSAKQSKPTRQSPRRLQNPQESRQPMEALESRANGVADESGPAQVMGPPPPQHQLQPSQLQKPKDLRRPVKPAKEAAPKPKPQPVAIRVGTLSQRIPLTNGALSSSLQESLPASQPKPPSLGKKPSNASLHTTASNGSLKTSQASTTNKPKALLAAERKKEQDEKEVQRKADQKREIERKRAAQQEELRRQEQAQRQEAERQRERERSAAVDDPKKIAQKQAIEKRRIELEKKNHQRAPQRPGNDAEKAQAAPTTYRQELGGARPPSRMHTVQDYSRLGPNHPAPNPAKPPIKRVFEPEVDGEPARPSRTQGGPTYQQADAKRRRTEDEEMQDAIIRPTMAPPIRQSNIRKDAVKPSVFNNNYTTAPPPATTYHATSLHKTTTVNQAYQQYQPPSQPARPNDMAKYTTAKIPFADAPNPPQPSHKTPMHSKPNHHHHHQQPHAKSSPHFPNGENIDLAEIATDSDTDTSSPEAAEKQHKKAMLPGWVQSPILNDTLRRQEELQNADDVFGPPAAVDMEGMFRERHHRFRQRTSSANWNGADRLTEEEVRRDLEGRERVRREGGWVFGL